MRPAMEICVESRAPFEPIGSFSTCTRIGSPSARSCSMGLVGSPLVFLCSQRSATWRNAARSSPISVNADCMPGSTRATRPMQMLPTSPRLAVRSMSSSCTTPAPVIATRVSRGVTLMRISSCTRSVQPLDELPGLIKRQAHYAGIAAAQMHDEQGGPHRRLRQVPLHHALPPGLGLGARHALHAGAGRFAGERGLVHLWTFAGARAEQQHVIAHADLAEQISPPRAARRQINSTLERAGHFTRV